MKTKNSVKIPRKTTHIIVTDAAGKTGKMDLKTFASLNNAEIESMGESLEFVSITGKGKKSAQKSLGKMPIAKSGEVEAIASAICDDAKRADGVEVMADIAPVSNERENIADELTNSVPTWNSKDVAPIVLRENSNVLNRFEYVPEPLMAGDKPSGYSILRCNDNGVLVGKPFAGSYGLLNNTDFISVIETICAVLEKMGIKYQVATSGTLMNRERSFISVQLTEFSKYIIDGREIHAFLNCLNSIPSNTGCTVTFANNTFTVCCRNTFAHALQCTDGTKFHAAIKHTSGMKAALNDVPRLVEAYISGNEKLFKTLGAFSVFPVSLTDAEGYFAAFIGRDAKGELSDKAKLSTRSANIVETLKELFVRGKGNKGQTAFDLFNAVTEYYTHFSAGDSDNKLKQYTSSEAGDGLVSKGEFYSWLVKHVQSTAGVQSVAKVGDALLVAYRQASATK